LANQEKTLIFFYNAQSGVASMMKDYFHKIFSPETYECNLCALSYDNLGMRREWKKFIEQLSLKTKFKYQDHLEYYSLNSEHPLPALFLQKDGAMHELLNAKEMNLLKDLGSLIEKTKKAIEAHI